MSGSCKCSYPANSAPQIPQLDLTGYFAGKEGKRKERRGKRKEAEGTGEPLPPPQKKKFWLRLSLLQHLCSPELAQTPTSDEFHVIESIEFILSLYICASAGLEPVCLCTTNFISSREHVFAGLV